MVTCCSECGKHFDILYPDLWAYKTGSKIFCSWHCLRADERKEEDEMTRLKKDGTPWGKPGPRKTTKTTKVPAVPAVEVPEKLNLQGGVNYQLKVDEAKKTPVNAIRVTAVDTELGSFSLVEGTNLIMWDADPNDYVEMTREGWETLAALIPKLMQTLGVEV